MISELHLSSPHDMKIERHKFVIIKLRKVYMSSGPKLVLEILHQVGGHSLY